MNRFTRHLDNPPSWYEVATLVWVDKRSVCTRHQTPGHVARTDWATFRTRRAIIDAGCTLALRGSTVKSDRVARACLIERSRHHGPLNDLNLTKALCTFYIRNICRVYATHKTSIIHGSWKRHRKVIIFRTTLIGRHNFVSRAHSFSSKITSRYAR